MSRENAGPSLQPARPRLSLPIRGDVLSGSRTSGTASSQHLSTPSRPPACFLQPQSQWHSLTGPLRDPSVCACRRALSAKGPDSSPSGAAGDRTDRSTCTRLLRPPSTSRLCHGGPPVRLPTQGRSSEAVKTRTRTTVRFTQQQTTMPPDFVLLEAWSMAIPLLSVDRD